MKQWMALLMAFLVIGMSIPGALAKTEQTTTVNIDADTDVVSVTAGADTTVDVVAADDDTETETELEAETEVEDEAETEVENEAVVAIAPSAAAVDAETETEVEAMSDAQGAQMRLMQLEEQIQRRILVANEVIADLEANNASANETAQLKAIVVQLETLAAEAHAAQTSVSAQSNQDAVAAFLDIKADAKELVKEFRDTAKPLVKDARAIKERAQEKESDLAELKAQIEAKRKEHNAARAQATLAAIGVIDADLAAKIEAGEISAEDARKEIKARFEALSDEEKQAAAEKVRELHTKARIATTDSITKVKAEAGERAVLRLEERARILDERGLTQASDMLERNAARIAAMQNMTAQDRQELRSEMRQRLDLGDDLGKLEVRSEFRGRQDGQEVRMERRERVKSDGTLEVRERTRIREDNSGSDDNEDENLEIEDAEDDE